MVSQEAADAIDGIIESLSEDQLDTLVREIKDDPEMVESAFEVSVRVFAEFISRHEMEDQLVSEIAPNEMVALIVTTQLINPIQEEQES